MFLYYLLRDDADFKGRVPKGNFLGDDVEKWHFGIGGAVHCLCAIGGGTGQNAFESLCSQLMEVICLIQLCLIDRRADSGLRGVTIPILLQ